MKSPLNVVFFLHPCALQSFGEQQYAVWFARQIQRDGYQPWFLTAPDAASRMRGTNFKPLIFESAASAKAMIEEIDPAMVIASEIYGLPPESAEMLQTLSMPLGTIDATTMGIEIAGDPFLTPDFQTDLILPDHYFSFRPCPANDIGIDTESVFHGSAFSGASRIPRSAARYQKLGLDPLRKTVLLPIAPWAQYFADLPDERFIAFRGYHDELIRRIARGLAATGEPVQLVVISERRPSPCSEKSVSIHATGLIPFDAYEHLLLSCDLVISDNIIQASMMKAVTAGIPHLVIQNMTSSAPPYPWNIFPLRQQFPPERELARVIEVAEFGDGDDICEKLVAISQRGCCDTRRRVLRQDYLSRVAALPTFSESLGRVVGPAQPRNIERGRTAGAGGPTVVFYLEIWFSFGEREHAAALAGQFQRAGYQVRFVVDRRVADHIRAAGFTTIVFYSPQMGIETVRKLDPVLIVGCELFNLSEESVRGLIALGKPMATVDGTSLGIQINTDPFGHPRLVRNLVLPDHYWSFRPSPVNDAGPDTDDTFYYNPFSREQRVAKDEDIYASIGLDPARKTVMLPIAMWALSCTTLFSLGSYHATLIDRVVSGLEDYGQPVDLLVIGLPTEVGNSSQGSVRKIFFERLPYGTYNHVLTSCDAIIADNIIQTSVSKAFVLGTPHLVIQNIAESEVPIRCNIFPLRVLFPAEREYARSVEVAEFGDAGGIRETIATILTYGHFDAERRNRRQKFLARLAELGDPSEALERILYESEQRGSVVR